MAFFYCEVYQEKIKALKKLIVELALCHFMNKTFFQVNLNYTNGELTLTVDYKFKTAQLFGLTFHLGDRVVIGSGDKSNSVGKSNLGIYF
jgi:hypothetical protein